MKRTFYILTLTLFFTSLLSAQEIFTDNFSANTIDHWTVISDNALVDLDNSQLWIHTPAETDHSLPTLLLPAVGSVNDMRIEILNASVNADGIALFKAAGNSYVATIVEGDSVRVLYSMESDSVEYVLFSQQFNPDSIGEGGSLSMSVSGTAPQIHVEMNFDNLITYSGDITAGDDNMNTGQAGIYIWGNHQDVHIDSVYYEYEPVFDNPTAYVENFNSGANGWFMYSEDAFTEVSDGKLHVQYNLEPPTNEDMISPVWLLPPVPPLRDGQLEAVTTGEVMNGESYVGRVNGSHYIVAIIDGDSIRLGYNDAFSYDHDAIIIKRDTFLVSDTEYHNFRMQFENTDSSVIVSVSLDSLTYLTGEILNPSEQLRYGQPVIVLYARNIDWYMDEASIEYYNTTGVETEDNHLPSDFMLMQNYPNPFNPTTKIRYSIPNNKAGTSQHVILKIYDLLGRDVETLVNKEQAPGNYEITFDAGSVSDGLPSGIYFYRLQAGNFTQTKKMILMK